MSCDYCDEKNGIATVYNEVYGNLNRYVLETAHFVVFPCMGQLREGHLLIASKAHINAMGMLDEKMFGELNELTLKISLFFKQTYQSGLFCFEHGVLSDNGENGGCGIYHLHLHLIPAHEDEFLTVVQHLENAQTNTLYPVLKLSDTRQRVHMRKTYIFIGYMNNTRLQEAYIAENPNNYFESQYMRKITCSVFKRKNWDWRKAIVPEPEFLKTLENSRGYFKAYK